MTDKKLLKVITAINYAAYAIEISFKRDNVLKNFEKELKDLCKYYKSKKISILNDKEKHNLKIVCRKHLFNFKFSAQYMMDHFIDNVHRILAENKIDGTVATDLILDLVKSLKKKNDKNLKNETVFLNEVSKTNFVKLSEELIEQIY